MSNGRLWRREVDGVAKQFGCEVSLTGSGHLMLEHPTGWSVLTGSTPSSMWKAMKKLRSQCRRQSKLTLAQGERDESDDNITEGDER